MSQGDTRERFGRKLKAFWHEAARSFPSHVAAPRLRVGASKALEAASCSPLGNRVSVAVMAAKSTEKRFRHPFLSIALGLGGFVCGCLVVGAGLHDPDGWFGSNTAAWVQAVGSIAAILAAIIIDQGASRRLRSDRAAETKARENAAWSAVHMVEAAASSALSELKGYEHGTFTINAGQFAAAVSVLRYHLAPASPPLSAAPLMGLAEAEACLVQTGLERGIPLTIYERRGAEQVRDTLNGLSGDIQLIVERYRDGIIR